MTANTIHIRSEAGENEAAFVDDIIALSLGVAAAAVFPIVALVVHQRRERRRNRRMGTRRTDKIRLTEEP
ncbi:MAG: hypothetical protein QOH04_1400 [Sphingomonadales bacterium]|nr:hypothetical protein [Sphingomonadales bacterium]MEA3035635.1 hypothetical protein [Sphingomonadales bacterium]